ncbi:MAG: T9SS type A sorting domain-containing protein [Aureispira sp.]|nr:T9SS type A sorting domain-containing protein [Aureispira sp.]
MKRVLLNILMLMALSFSVNAQWGQLNADIDGEVAGDKSGSAVCLSADGTIVAIAARENDGGPQNGGHVRVFKNAGGAWTQVGVDINGEAAADYSGYSLSMNSAGTIVAIGAAGNDGLGGSGSNYGHVRVYENISGTWTQIGTDIDGEAIGDGSGYSVSLDNSGTTVAIGSIDNDGNGVASGHVRVYENISGTWTQIGTDIDGEFGGDKSASSVSLSANGTIVAIGATENNGNGTNSGHVRVYENISGTWTQVGADIDGEVAGDKSGSAVCLSADGTIVAIAARENDGVHQNGGHVRVFENISGTWTQVGADIDGEAIADYSGYSLSMNANGTVVAIGAAGNDGIGGAGANYGHVRVYENISGTWTQVEADIDGEAVADGSGYSVALDSAGSTIAIGAQNNDGNGTDAGHVRVYLNANATCTVTIPDANFKAYLVGNTAINLNGDSEIQCNEASAFTGTISCNGLSITDLTGIEAFTSLSVLYCHQNSLAILDLSSNTSLVSLGCHLNSLTTLDLSLNTSLIRLYAYSNTLTALNLANGNNTNVVEVLVGNNPSLTCIKVDDVAYSTTNWVGGFFQFDSGASFNTSCSACLVNIPDANFKAYLVGNTAINLNGDSEIQCNEASAFTGSIICSGLSISDLTGIEAFTSISNLYCNSNSLTTLDLSSNTLLNILYCFSNQLTSIDVSQNTALTILYCENNSLTTLDLSNNSALIGLKCMFNSLTSLNVANGNNTNVTLFNAYNNPNLLCIEVDDATYSTTNWTNVDVASFSTNCAYGQTYVPDDNFENFLETHNAGGVTVPVGDPTSMGNGIANDNYVTTANISTVAGLLDVSNENISDLTGIEDFVALTQLHCYLNPLTTLDVSANTALIHLYCHNNQLTTLDVSANTSLTKLICHTNSFTSLDLTTNTLLSELNCSNGQLTSLIVPNAALTSLNCSSNQLTGLDVSTNTALATFNCSFNQIASLDVSTNTALTYLACNNNQLTSLNVANGNNTNITFFNALVNQNLSCIEVDDDVYSAANWTYIDATASFSTDCSVFVGVEEVRTQMIRIYPNPATTQLTIESPALGIKNISILDVTGKTVQTITQNTKTISVADLVEGIYFLQIQSQNGITNSKFIKK